MTGPYPIVVESVMIDGEGRLTVCGVVTIDGERRRVRLVGDGDDDARAFDAETGDDLTERIRR